MAARPSLLADGDEAVHRTRHGAAHEQQIPRGVDFYDAQAELGLRVVRIDAERNLLFVRGSVPGPMNGLVTVRKQGGPSRHD